MKYRIFLSEKLDKRWISIYNRNDCVFIIIDYFFFKERFAMAKKSIVVVGAGYAGVSATKYMAKKLKKTMM